MTVYIKENSIDKHQLLTLGAEVRKGKTIVFKTDTVYGIGTNAFDEDACKKVYEIKGRPPQKPLCVLISNISMLKELVDSLNSTEQKLIDAFWPGPLTIKFKKKLNVLPDIISAGDEFVRVRLLDRGIAYNLINASGVPIVAPSANLSGSATGTNIENITSELNGKVDYIIDSGNVNDDTTSTIIEVANDKIILIREGKITKEELSKIASVENII